MPSQLHFMARHKYTKRKQDRKKYSYNPPKMSTSSVLLICVGGGWLCPWARSIALQSCKHALFICGKVILKLFMHLHWFVILGHYGQVCYDLLDDCVSVFLWFLSNDQLSRVTTPGKERSFCGVCQRLETIGTARVSLICYRAILPPCQKMCQSKDSVCVFVRVCVHSLTPILPLKPWWQAILASTNILMEL